MKGKILIVSVIFRQRIEDTNVYMSLLKGYGDVYLYDNSPTPQDISNLPAEWVYISDPKNPGLSAAYNKAAEYAKQHGYEWLLICDQDTSFPPNAIDTYIKSIQKDSNELLFVPKVKVSDSQYMSPVRQRGYISKLANNVETGKIKLKDYGVINSGILVNVDAFIECGGYNEKVFLDFADFQFMERLAKVSPTAMVIDLICRQNFSNITDSIDTKLKRFAIFCRSLSGFESNSRLGKVNIYFIMFKRALSLCVQAKSPRPMAIFMKNYVN